MVAAEGSREARRVLDSRQRESGQAIVETALVMPLFVFIVLGLIQLGLMNQARLMTKYAAYKAVRAGALRSGNMKAMETAALAVVLPMVSIKTSIPNGSFEKVQHVSDGSGFSSAFSTVASNSMPEGSGMQYVEVTICNPTTDLIRNANNSTKVDGREEYDFDNALNATSSGSNGGDSEQWKAFMRTKLIIQVTFNYRMMIPFANMMMFYIAAGQEKARQNLDDMFELSRMTVRANEDGSNQKRFQRIENYVQLARSSGVYVLPIRAAYEMRMQSNLFPQASGFQMPSTNECKAFFPKMGEGGTGTVGGPVTDPDEEEIPNDD